MADLVLLDLGCPASDGFEVAAGSVAGRRRLALIAAVTAYRGEEHQRQAREAGFDRYLTKPVDLESLREILDQASAAAGLRKPSSSWPMS